MRTSPIFTILAIPLLACVGSEVATTDGLPEVSLRSAFELTRIGSVNDLETTLTSPRSITVGPNGDIYSLHDVDHEVRIHRPDGSAVGRFGREGEGPGEFQLPTAFGFVADTLWVSDQVNGFSYFSTDGQHLRTVRPVPPEGVGARTLRKHLLDGSFAGTPGILASRLTSNEVMRNPVFRFDPSTRSVDTVYVERLASTVVDIRIGAGTRYLFQPYAYQTRYSFSRNYTVIFAVESDPVSTEARPKVTVLKIRYGSTVDTLAVAQVPYIPQLIDDAAFDAKVDSLIAVYADQVSSTSSRDIERQLRKKLYRPTHISPIRRLVLGVDDRLWIEMSDAEGNAWVAIDGDDLRTLFRVHLPDGFRGFTASGDTIWGEERDELDVSYIVGYEARLEAERTRIP